MGIPSYFKSILQRYPTVIRTDIPSIDYLFFDFNSLIYRAYQETSVRSHQRQFESDLIQKVISIMDHMIHQHVKPVKEIYISIDGVAPMAKMIQQRSRRYKSILLNKALSFHFPEIPIDEKKKWIPSFYISPGTMFMKRLEKSLDTYRQRRSHLCLHISGSDIPGEGEHKFLSQIRKLRDDPITRDCSVVIYSPDGDLLSLSSLTHKSNIWIMRIPDPHSPEESRFTDPYIYCNIDKLMDKCKSIHVPFLSEEKDLSFRKDYNVLLMLTGNDFIHSLPYLKIRSNGLTRLLSLYSFQKKKDSSFSFVNEQNELQISSLFSIFEQLALTEQRDMKKEWKRYEDASRGRISSIVSEHEMSPYELFSSRYQHLSFFHPDHPLFSQYGHLWKSICIEEENWRDQYHAFFFPEQPWNSDFQQEIVYHYLESLVFTWYYYTRTCPSYYWYYRYRMPPLPSDILHVLQSSKDRPLSWQRQIQASFQSETRPPIQPLEQLLYIFPQSAHRVLPTFFHSKIQSYSDYYPPEEEVVLDALAGGKFIYSEILLPSLSLDLIRSWVREYEHSKSQT